MRRHLTELSIQPPVPGPERVCNDIPTRVAIKIEG
jgi:hypothetical protein